MYKLYTRKLHAATGNQSTIIRSLHGIPHLPMAAPLRPRWGTLADLPQPKQAMSEPIDRDKRRYSDAKSEQRGNHAKPANCGEVVMDGRLAVTAEEESSADGGARA